MNSRDRVLLGEGKRWFPRRWCPSRWPLPLDRQIPAPACGREVGLQRAEGGPGLVEQQRPGLWSRQEPRAGGARNGQEVVCGERRRGRACAMWLSLRFLLWKPDSCGRGPGSPFPRGQLVQLQALGRRGREDVLGAGEKQASGTQGVPTGEWLHHWPVGGGRVGGRAHAGQRQAEQQEETAPAAPPAGRAPLDSAGLGLGPARF